MSSDQGAQTKEAVSLYAPRENDDDELLPAERIFVETNLVIEKKS